MQSQKALFQTFACGFLTSQVISEGLGFICALMTRQATFAIICLTFLLLILLSFSGEGRVISGGAMEGMQCDYVAVATPLFTLAKYN